MTGLTNNLLLRNYGCPGLKKIEMEKYRVAICIDKGLSKDSKLLILLDVYVCHRGPDFIELMKDL